MLTAIMEIVAAAFLIWPGPIPSVAPVALMHSFGTGGSSLQLEYFFSLPLSHAASYAASGEEGPS